MCRGVGDPDSVLITKFWRSLNYAVSAAVMPFGVFVLAYSHPLRDPSWRSKAGVAGCMIVLGVVFLGCMLSDLGRYWHLWPYQGQQLVLQMQPLFLLWIVASIFLPFQRVRVTDNASSCHHTKAKSSFYRCSLCDELSFPSVFERFAHMYNASACDPTKADSWYTPQRYHFLIHRAIQEQSI